MGRDNAGEMGRAAMPGPFLSTVVAGRLVVHAGDRSGIDDAGRGLDVAESIASKCGPRAPVQPIWRGR